MTLTLPKGRWFSYSVDVTDDGKLKLDLRLIGPPQPPFIKDAPALPAFLRGSGFTVACGDENGNGKPDVTVELRFKGKTLLGPVTADVPAGQALGGMDVLASLLPEPAQIGVRLLIRGLRTLIPGA